MGEKTYFHLLILCGILSHGIIGTCADEEIKESSDFLVRHKRVVSHVPGEDSIVQISDFEHVVIIKNPRRIHCVGSILSIHVVITAAQCVPMTPEHYQITSATSVTNRGQNYNVVDIRRHLAISLLITGRFIIFGAYSRQIELNVAPLLPGTIGQVSGWGFNWRALDRGTSHPTHLRSIEVPIIAHRDCVERYRPRITITDKEVCTYHPQRHSGHNDFGAGLVVNGYLAGVFLWSGLNQSSTDPQYPDVFAVLQDSVYSNWIRSNMQNIDPHQAYQFYSDH